MPGSKEIIFYSRKYMMLNEKKGNIILLALPGPKKVKESL